MMKQMGVEFDRDHKQLTNQATGICLFIFFIQARNAEKWIETEVRILEK